MRQLTKNRRCIPNYRRGTELWEYSDDRDDYWEEKLSAEADAYINDKNVLGKLEKTLSHLGLSGLHYVTNVKQEVYEQHKPKRDSIHALIFPDGPNTLCNSLYETARILFPNSKIILARSRSVFSPYVVYILEEKIVFDLYGYYYTKYDQDAMYALPRFPECRIIDGETWLDIACRFNDIVRKSFIFPSIPVDSRCPSIIASINKILNLPGEQNILWNVTKLSSVEKRSSYDILRQSAAEVQWVDRDHPSRECFIVFRQEDWYSVPSRDSILAINTF